MKIRRNTLLLSPLALFLLLLPAANADVMMKLVGTPSGAYGGIYISPYQLTVNGVNMLLNCDDFGHDVSVNDTWQATVIPGTSNNLLSTQMAQAAVAAGVIANTEVAAEALYDAKAWIEIYKLNVAPDLYSRAVASYAIWRLFQPGLVDTHLAGHTTVQFRNDVTQMVNDAKAPHPGLHNYLTIYSPSAVISSGPHKGLLAQEFDQVHVPDGGTTAALLGGAILGLTALLRKWRPDPNFGSVAPGHSTRG